MGIKYFFDSFILDTSVRELSAEGVVVKIEPKVFDLLLHLIENRDHVVSKDELVASIWEGRFISEAAVSSAIRSVRKALGDDGKNQRYVRTMHGHGFRFIAPVVQSANKQAHLDEAGAQELPIQDIRYCSSADGTTIAYAVAGVGPPLVKVANWLNHLEFDWESPVWKHFFKGLASAHRLIRYDARGNGLSSWGVSDFSFERQVEDLEAVVNTLGLDRFPLFGLSRGCAEAVAFAAQHPERVTKLILLGGYARGWRYYDAPDSIAVGEALCALIRARWGSDNQAVRQMLTMYLMPDAPAESQSWFNDLQKKTASADNAANILMSHGLIDIRGILPDIRIPTLVIHARHDAAVPYKQGRELAAGIKDARFVTLDTANHILPVTDPAWSRCMRLIDDFLKE